MSWCSWNLCCLHLFRLGDNTNSVNSIRQALCTGNHLPSASLKVGSQKVQICSWKHSGKGERAPPSTVEASITLARAWMDACSCCCCCGWHPRPFGELGLPSSASCGTFQNMLRGLHLGRVKLVLGESWGRQQHLSWPFNSKSQNRMIEPTCVFDLSSSVGGLNMFL